MKVAGFLVLVLSQPAAALTLEIDYTYDTGNFFNTQARRDAIETVAKFYGDLIQDKLLRIHRADFPGSSWTGVITHPATGNAANLSNPVIPEDTVIVYVGGRVLSGGTLGIGGPGGWSAAGSSAWFDRIEGRGSAGAVVADSFKTDFSPWGGSISFDSDRTWNFSLTQNLTGSDFISVALHEMGHVLGIGTAESWDNQISSSVFAGDASVRSYGTVPPVQSGGGHFGGTGTASKAFGSFNVAHGLTRQVLMLPTLSDSGANLLTTTDLDLAALLDIGWEIRPPFRLNVSTLGPGSSSFTWNSTSFFNYQVQRGSTLQGFPAGSGNFAGNGTIQSWTDPSPAAGSAFYRLAVAEAFPASGSIPSPARASIESSASTSSKEPRVIECGDGSGQ